MTSFKGSGRQVGRDFERAVDRMGPSGEEEQVEQLLAELGEQSLLALRVDGHRVRGEEQKGVAELHGGQHLQPDTEGVEGDLAIRLALLKGRSVRSQQLPATGRRFVKGSPDDAEQAQSRSVEVQPIRKLAAMAAPTSPAVPDPQVVDSLGEELASRLQALRASSQPRRGGGAATAATGPIPAESSVVSSSFRHPRGSSREPKLADRAMMTAGPPASLGMDSSERRKTSSVGGRALKLGEQHSTTRSYWGKGRCNNTAAIGQPGLAGTEEIGHVEAQVGAGEVDEREVQSMLAAMADELHLQSKSQSMVSGSGYVCEDDEGSESELSDGFVEAQAEGIMEWAKDLVDLDTKIGRQGLKEEGTKGMESSRLGALRLSVEEESDQEEQGGYLQDDEDGGSVRRCSGAPKKR